MKCMLPLLPSMTVSLYWSQKLLVQQKWVHYKQKKTSHITFNFFPKLNQVLNFYFQFIFIKFWMFEPV